ncbi:hypothetical protein GCM10011576_25110 [Micromonospora parathelypteridis]|nr:hypothetical protein GCM10011576_25110 [Micromonospora parathelypteridis]
MWRPRSSLSLSLAVAGSLSAGYGYPHAMQALLVDLLPMTLWQPANLYAGGRLHFCVGWSDERTVEWQGRQILAGKPGGAARINQRYFQPKQGD